MCAATSMPWKSVLLMARPDEIAFFLCMTTGGRPHERMGGLKASEISARDGLR